MKQMKTILLLCLCAALLLAGCGKEKTETPAVETMTYTVSVCTAGGMGLEKINIYVYEDSTLQELVAVVKTDAEGKASFTDAQRDTYVAVLKDLPTGYATEEFYALTGNLTEIVLSADQLSADEMDGLTYKLGDAMMDFTVTSPGGTEYTFNGLFKDKKAMVLNFFFNECQPCMNEFPFLQEAYEQYSDDIAVLAMNPVNTDSEAIAALQKELGITFPMVACDPKWESMMQITAYPTTVIIDRFGNICLIHTGSVPNTKTFTDAFAYFTADNYEQKLIEAIGDLAIEEEEEEDQIQNPTEISGVTKFELTVKPGEVVYTDIHKVMNMYLTIKDKNAYVVYKDKTYYPKNGKVSVKISVPDTFTPITVGVGNTSEETLTFKASLVAPSGSFANPKKLALGDFTAKISAGNEQGVYYTYTAPEDGTLTLRCVSVSKNVKYDYYLFNTKTSAMRNLESDSQKDENGNVTVSIQAKKGQKIQVCISTLPDKNGSYPSATFQFHAAFTGLEIKEEEKVVMTDYTVKVVDGESKPMANISIVLKNGDTELPITTTAEGVAKISLVSGTYEGSFYVPDGYKAEKTTFTLTEAAPSVTLMVTPIQKLDYTVKVQDEAGAPIAFALLKVGEGQWQFTDMQGQITVTLDEGSYTVTLMVPQGYIGETAYTFPENSTELTVILTAAQAGSPSDPTNPTTPSNPTNPTTPGNPTDPTTPSDPTDPTTPSNPTDPTTPSNPTDPTTPSNPTNPTTPSNPTNPTTPSDPTAPTEPTQPSVPGVYAYTVNVMDAFGAPVKNLPVVFMRSGTPVYMAMTNDFGSVSFTTEDATPMTVELATEYYYDKALAVLSPTQTLLAVKLYQDLDETKFEEIYILNGNPAYVLNEGGTHVTLGVGRPNFSAEYGNNCFFVFTPETAGTYQITASNGLELTYWNTPSFINCLFSSKDEGNNNALTMSISGTTVGNVTYIIGVKADTGITDAVVTVARIGDPEFSIADQPWREWTTGASHTDAWKKEIGATLNKDGTAYNYNFQVNYLDITAASGKYNLYYDEANGYYRLSKGGPIVLVDLGAEDRFVALFERVNGKNNYGGSAVTRYFFDETGAFLGKENYTEYLDACFTEMKMSKDNPYGFYPLTKDLMYVLQNGFADWWNPDSYNYLEGFATANKTYAWMFACCVVK